MILFKIIIISVLIFELWFLQLLYKNDYNKEVKLNIKQLNLNLKMIEDYSRINDELYQENQELEMKIENITRELLSRDKKYNELLEENKRLKGEESNG